MIRVLRGFTILWTAVRFGLLSRANRAQRLRLGLEHLGPIFVKLGQVLSTRADLLPPDIAQELSKLQDKVKPFDGKLAIATIEDAFGQPLEAIFASFDPTPSPALRLHKSTSQYCDRVRTGKPRRLRSKSCDPVFARLS